MTIPNTVVFSKPATAVPTAPQLVEYNLTTAASEPGGIVAGPDGALWFVETTVNKIGRISTDGVVTEYAVRTAGAIDQDQGFLTVGPEGALWFVEDSVDQIGRITLDGKLTEYALPKNVKALRMTVGPDKAMWFTMYTANKIGRISTDGKLTTFDAAGMGPVGITSGTDGAIRFWQIWKVNNPSGVFIGFDVLR